MLREETALFLLVLVFVGDLVFVEVFVDEVGNDNLVGLGLIVNADAAVLASMWRRARDAFIIDQMLIGSTLSHL